MLSSIVIAISLYCNFPDSINLSIACRKTLVPCVSAKIKERSVTDEFYQNEALQSCIEKYNKEQLVYF